MFKQLIEQIKSLHTAHNEFLDALIAQYPEMPTQAHPIILSEASYKKLVDIVISEGKKTALLTTLIGMGTWQGPIDDEMSACNPVNQDAYLGRKDPRIEAYIATRAKEEILRRKKIAVAHTRNIAVFGGSMNPPTESHLTFIKHLMDSGYFVEIVPNAASPLKPPAQYAPQRDRYEMIRLALMARAADISPADYHVSTVEIDRPAPSRMFMTLCALILLSEPSDKFTLMLTLDDNFEGFHKWYQWSEFGHLCSLKFYPRPGMTEIMPPEILKSQFHKLLNAGIHIIIPYHLDTEIAQFQALLDAEIITRIEWRQEDSLQTLKGSSSGVRADLKSTPHECPSGLPEIVYQYILDHRLYERQRPVSK